MKKIVLLNTFLHPVAIMFYVASALTGMFFGIILPMSGNSGDGIVDAVAPIIAAEIAEAKKASLDLNGARCTTLEREPILTYNTSEQTVTLVIECSPDILFHYTEALEATTDAID